jgi:hypothetical protein
MEIGNIREERLLTPFGMTGGRQGTLDAEDRLRSFAARKQVAPDDTIPLS